MASLVLSGDTSGSITVSAPAVAGSTTQTLVAVTGTLAPIVSGTAITLTTQTNVDFTGIPSWVKRITVMFNGVSTSSTTAPRVQLGTGSTPTYVNSGYAASACAMSNANTTAIAAFTDGFPFARTTVAADTMSSIMTIVNITGTIWVASANTRSSGNTLFFVASGQVDAAATVTALRITINGTDTFDAGTINIIYE